MQDDDTFDREESEAGKTNGMALAAANASEQLDIARQIAYELAFKGNGFVCMDDVGKLLKEKGISVGPWCGSVFKEKGEWEFTGQRVNSHRITNHARELKVWRLKSYTVFESLGL